jgi:Predicted membrane protein (DUF2306)
MLFVELCKVEPPQFGAHPVHDLSVTSAKSEETSARVLRQTVCAWFVLTLLGQWIFAFYIFAEFGAKIWENSAMQLFKQPQINGSDYSLASNWILLVHVSIAAAINVLGIMQLVPRIRKKLPHLHRWNGRLFLSLGCVAAAGGLYLTWFAGARMSNYGAIGITVNGILILLFAPLAWHYARQRDIARHQRIAVHAFLLVNGVWFFRLSLMSWIVLNHGPWGNSDKLDGPADIALSFLCYLLPMAIAEACFWAQHQRNAWANFTAALLLALTSLLMMVGIFAATAFMWGPTFHHVAGLFFG